MPVVSLRYHFRQPLRVPAASAFRWCTDFGPSDGELFSHRTRRRITRIAPDTLVMTDTTFPEGRVRTIRRLVRIFPEERAWTNTHLDGPFRHSQFWYRIVPAGRARSYLDFHGLKVETVPRPLSAEELRRRAAENGRSDAAEWRGYLAPALERELGALPGGDRPRARPKRS
jgi:hypothetical protein